MNAPIEAQLVPGVLRGYRAWSLLNPRVAVRMTGVEPASFGWREAIAWWAAAVLDVTDVFIRQFRPCPPVELVGRYLSEPWGVERRAVCTVEVPTIDVLYMGSRAYHGSGRQYRPLHTTPAPEPSCKCGVYAMYSPYGERYRRETGWMHVDGVVEASGRTIMNEYGFRSQAMRIIALTVPSAIPFAAFHESYPDVELFFDRRDMYAEYPVEDLSALGITLPGDQVKANEACLLADRPRLRMLS